MKNIFISILLITLIGCSNDYDYSGKFTLLDDQCESVVEKSTLITVTSNGSDENPTYRAQLSNAFRGSFPLKSKKADIDDDGSITFEFYKEGKSGIFSIEPSTEMSITLDNLDDEFVIITEWPVSIIHPNSADKGVDFDMVKDRKINMLGTLKRNFLYQYVGDEGLCLRHDT